MAKNKPIKKTRPPTRRKKARPTRGNRTQPLLAVAVLCESVLVEQSALTSAIRILDRVTVTGESPTFVPGVVPVTLYVVFKSGDAIGRRTLEIDQRSPNQSKPVRISESEMEFTGEEQGAAAQIKHLLHVSQEGLYWFDVRLNGELRTRIPLRVLYQERKK